MHPVRGIGLGAVGFGALVVAFWVGVAPGLELEPDDELMLRSVLVFGVVAALVGSIMAARPGHRPVPWDFEDWLEELGWTQRGAYLVAVLAGSAAGLWLFEPWAPLASMFQ
jgi:hypothetical protein